MSRNTHFIYFGEINNSVLETLSKLDGKVLVQIEKKIQIDHFGIDTGKHLVSDKRDKDNTHSWKTLGKSMSENQLSFDNTKNENPEENGNEKTNNI